METLGGSPCTVWMAAGGRDEISVGYNSESLHRAVCRSSALCPAMAAQRAFLLCLCGSRWENTGRGGHMSAEPHTGRARGAAGLSPSTTWMPKPIRRAGSPMRGTRVVQRAHPSGPGKLHPPGIGQGGSERVVHAAGPIGRRNPPPTFLRRKDKREPCLCRIDTHGTGAPIHMEKLHPPCKHKEKKNSTNRPSSVKRYIS